MKKELLVIGGSYFVGGCSVSLLPGPVTIG
jgi:hypothetical protein